MTRPIFVTGSQRSGTSWLASVLAAGGQVAFLDEPFSHKQRNPGQCAVDFPHWFTYVGPHNGAQFAPAVGETLRLRYDLPAALGRYARRANCAACGVTGARLPAIAGAACGRW